jgi:hypothetical protein
VLQRQYLGLVHLEQAGRRNLGMTALFKDLIDYISELQLGLMFFGIGNAKIGILPLPRVIASL